MDVEAKEGRVMESLYAFILTFKSLFVLVYSLINRLICKISGCGNVKVNKCESNSNNNLEQRAKEISKIPGPRSLPFFGTLLTSTELKSNNLRKSNEDREEKYGIIVKEETFWNFPFIIVLGSDEISQILRTNSVARPGTPIVEIYRSLRADRYVSLGLVNSQGETWKNLHQLFSPVTNRKFVATLLTGVNDIVTDALEIFETQPKNEPVNSLSEILNKFISEITFFITFGQRSGFVGKAREEMFRKKLEIFTNCHDSYWNAFHQSMYGFPFWKYLPGSNIWKSFVEAEDKMLDMITELSKELLNSDKKGGVLGAVPVDKLDPRDLNLVLLELVLGATEPVYHTLIISLYWITKYDHIYERLLEELREQMPTEDTQVDADILANIPYLKACVMETFRICPVACNLARFIENEVEVGGYRLPPGSLVIVQTWHACLKDENFYRAKEFLPERWLLENGTPPFYPHNPQFMSHMGSGTRACPGRKIAMQLIHTFLCKVLRKFRVKFTRDIELKYEWLLIVDEPVSIEISELET